MTHKLTLQYRLEGDELVIFKDGQETRIPAGQDILQRLPHVMLSELTDKEREAVAPVLAAFGGAGMNVWERDDEAE